MKSILTLKHLAKSYSIGYQLSKISKQTINMSSINNVQNELNIALTTGVERMAKTYGKQLVTLLASKFDFPEEEAMAYLDIVKVTKAKPQPKEKKAKVPKKEKPAVPLPFVGQVDEELCKGIKNNHMLFTQCTMKPLESGDYCKTCQKHADMNASGKPKFGDIRDRAQCGLMEFEAPNGKKPVSYGTVVKKMNLDMEVVKREAEKFGVVIPDEQWEVSEKKRGRPKSVSSKSSDDESESKQKRGRGRPKKVKEVESNVDDDLLSALKEADEAKTTKKPAKKPIKNPIKKTTKKTQDKAVEEVSSTDEEEEKPTKKPVKKTTKKTVKIVEPEPESEPEQDTEDEEEVELFKHDGVTYYRSSDNVLYDTNTQEPVGKWNPNTKEVEEIEYDSNDEVEWDDSDDE